MVEFDSMESVRILCPKLVFHCPDSGPGVYWLVGSPFFPPFTVVSSLRCIHALPSDSSSPDLRQESEEFRSLIIKGFEIIGALALGNSDVERNARKSIDAARGLRKLLYGEGKRENQPVVGAVAGLDASDIRFFVSKSGLAGNLESVTSIVYEDHPEKYVWEKGCLLQCELPVKLPLYYAANTPHDVEKAYSRATEAVIAKLRDPQAVYMLEASSKSTVDLPPPAIIQGEQLDFSTDLSMVRPLAEGDDGFDAESLPCSYFSMRSKSGLPIFHVENADTIQVSVFFNSLLKSTTPAAPVAEYLPVQEEARLLVVDIKLDVLCYAAKELPLSYAVSSLVVPGLVDQLNTLQKLILPNLLAQHPKVWKCILIFPVTQDSYDSTLLLFHDYLSSQQDPSQMFKGTTLDLFSMFSYILLDIL